ncbi:GNAT family N-acetyltransferase [Pimelobacter simplex]|uniref:GNAT family N-acetyltransferase n=1 Tax=Nocardioides simplex TaxID=2045 RepID=UPI00382F5CBD
MRIATDDPRRADVLALLDEHLADMYATSPAESVHALDPEALAAPGITFWTARDAEAGDLLLGCAALKRIDEDHAELKSMRTATAARRRGVAGRLLDHVLDAARAAGHRRISLETGTQDYFAAARALYVNRGFEVCGPFEGYTLDPSSTFLTRAL